MTEIEVKLQLKLHQNQLAVHRHPAKNKAVLAGKRFGKTKWLLFELCKAAAHMNNGVFWYVAPTYKQAKQIAWYELKALLPRQLIRRQVETDLFTELISGSRLQLIGADNEDSLRGPKLNGVGLDECDYMKEYVWSGIIQGQLLGANEQDTGFAYFISSPNGRGRSWFPAFHKEAERKMLAGDKDWAAFFYTIYDNPLLSLQEVEKLKERTSDDTWNLEYMAQASALAGQLFNEFSRTKNLGEYEGKKSLPIVRGLDWGINHPTVCLWAKIDVEQDTIYISDELQKTDMVIQELCQRIKAMSGDAPIEATICDPSLNKRNSQTLRTDMTEFTRWGVPCQPGDNRERGYDIVKMLLKQGRLKISPKCRNLIYGLENLQYGEDVGDDACDSARYLCTWVHDRFPGWKRSVEQDPKPRDKKPGSYNLDELLQKKPANDYSFYTDEETYAHTEI